MKMKKRITIKHKMNKKRTKKETNKKTIKQKINNKQQQITRNKEGGKNIEEKAE